jgi:diamine N-acetyltransferase
MLRIRPAETSDLVALSELAERTWSDAFGDSVSPTDLAAELETRRSKDYFTGALREATILVADQAGVLVGYVQFGDVTIPEVPPWPGARALHRLYVDTPFQGQGVGRRLMEEALGHPRLATASRIYLTVWERNGQAIRLYENLGFRRAGTTTFTVGSEVMEDLVMVLDLLA